VCSNPLEDPVACRTPCGRVCGDVQFGRAPRYEGGRGSPLQHGFIARARVVRSVPGHLTNRIGNLFQQSRQWLTVVDATAGEFHRDNLFRVLIDPQM